MSVKCSRFIVWLTVITCLGLLGLPVWAQEEASLEVHFIDVGQGDSILLHTSTGVDILIDAGQPPYGKKVLAYLETLGIQELDYVIGTHPHADHIGGLLDVVSDMPIQMIIDPGVPYATGVFESYLGTIKEKKVPFKTVLKGDEIAVEDPFLKLQVFAPYEDQLEYGDDVNDVSVVIRASYGDVSFLLMGDAGFPTEDRLVMEKAAMESTVLKVGHHGSKYSTGELFLLWVEPEVAVIPVGDNNYGHPTAEVLGRLESRNVDTYRNDFHGTVVIRTNGQTYEIETEKEYVEEVDQRVNINTAFYGDLIELPGVTYELAQEIVEYREMFGMFLSEKELLRVDLMTSEILEGIVPWIKFVD